MSVLAESNISESSKSTFSTMPLLWHAVLATAALIAIVAFIASQPEPEAIDYPAGIAVPF